MIRAGDLAISIIGSDGFADGKALADARLIAAAPELLEALQLIAQDYETTKDGTYGDRSASYAETARAAITKATGE